MAQKTRTKKKKSTNDEFFTISEEKKRKILGIILLFLALVIFLSIVSYSSEDTPYNLFDSVFVEGSKTAEMNNWLGIIGVHLARFFIHSTIGIFSIIFPVILGMWGYAFFTKLNRAFLVNFSLFLLLMGLLLSSFMGVLRQGSDYLRESIELSGAAGGVIGEFLTGLIGMAGAIILILASLVVLLVIAFDIKIERIFEFIKNKSKQAVENRQERNFKKQEDRKRQEKEEKQDKKKQQPKESEPGTPEEKREEQTQININRAEQKRRAKEREDIEDARIIEETEGDSFGQGEPPLLISERKEEPKKEDKEQKPKKIIDKKENKRKDDFPVEKEVSPYEVEAELPEPWDEEIIYQPLQIDVLDPVPFEDVQVADEELSRNAQLLKEKLALFDIEINKISVTPGPVVTLYEIVPAPGVKISKIVSLEHDIALALAARGIRIIAPIPGKSAIGVEIPNRIPSKVVAAMVLEEIKEYDAYLPLALGKTINGDVKITDLADMPHLLIAGSTGSGKSVGINMMITSILFAKHPSEVKFAIIDPKKIELSFYHKLRQHYLAICPDLDEEIVTVPTNAVLLLKSVETEMEKRYDMLAKAGVRNIVDYNKKLENPVSKPQDSEKIKHHFMPYIVVIIDELADLMITAGKDVEEPIARLAQMARAVGIHLIVATQRPSSNVITGLIKANFSARVAYQVASKIDSRIILDMNGAEQLLGKGDMLFLPAGSPKPERVQNAFISTDEVERLTDFIDGQEGYSKPYYLPSIYEKKGGGTGSTLDDLDEMFEDAAFLVVRTGQGSISMLQRKLKLGYSRAARIVDQLEDAGIVGPNDGSKARDVIVDNEDDLLTIIRNL